jgi:hypothetical protein
VSAELLEIIAQAGGTLGLAVLALVMLRRSYEQLVQAERAGRERLQGDNERMAAVIDRNTASWVDAARALVEISGGLAAMAESLNASRENLADIRVIMARRPMSSEAVQRRFEWGVVFYVAGRFWALYGADPDGTGPADGYWGTIGRNERYVPLMEPVPGLGFCLESAADDPMGSGGYEMDLVEGPEMIELRDDQGRPVRLEAAGRTWSAAW